MKLIIVFLLLVIASFSGFGAFSIYKENRAEYLAGRNVLYPESEVLGVNSDEIQVVVDYSKQIAKGSPLIFGGAHSPDLTHTKAWEEIESAGITSIRKDFYLDRYLPQKITLDQYKKNINNVQDPINWNQTEINKVKNIYKEARGHNMKTIGILAYAIRWLTYNNSNYGVPKDWPVYEDIVAKSYRLFRDDIDYLEIWNEPDLDFFLDTKNVPINDEDGYYLIVKHAVAAVRRVDGEINDGKKMKIGVGVLSRPENVRLLEKILADKSISSQIDFVSYHNYEWLQEPSDVPVKKMLNKYNLGTLPIFLTEWAHTPNIKQSDSYVLSDQAISYAGSKLIDFLNMGLAGANYFSMQPIMPQSKRGDEGMLGFYTTQGDSISMLPIIKTWALMSQTLKLGNGPSKIYETDGSNDKIAAWVNIDNEFGVVISNETFEVKQYNFTLYNLPYKEDVLLNAFVASANQDGKQKIGSTILKSRSTGATFKAVVPPNSVVGIKVSEASWRDKLTF